MMVTPCGVTSGMNHLGSDLIKPLEVASYVPHQGTTVVLEVQRDVQTSPKESKEYG